MTVIIGAILVAAFLFAFGCGVVLLINLGEFLISYYGAIIFVIPFVVSISLLAFVLILYAFSSWSKKQKRTIDKETAQKIREINNYFEKYYEQKSKEDKNE